jgi:MoaA/NifB/PqqE/SkfB family radical SAM enzyme
MINRLKNYYRIFRCWRKSSRVVLFDISGVCNAKCHFCATGYRNRYGGEQPTTKFVDVNTFKKAIKYLLDNSFVSRHGLIDLYNWGEPFLHPHLDEILQFLWEGKLMVGLSTNAAKLVQFPKELRLDHVAQVIFSMSGFSQESYDKIHGFDFEMIKDHMARIVRDFRARGCVGRMKLSFHVYQFNIHEIPAAQKFAKSLGMRFWPYCAFIDDWEKMNAFIDHTLPKDYLERVATDLFMGIYPHHQTPVTICPQLDHSIALDQDCNVRLCCINKNCLGKLFDLTWEDIWKWKREHPDCRRCLESGMGNVINGLLQVQSWKLKNTHKRSLLHRSLRRLLGRKD